MTPATCILGLSLFIVAGCASVGRAPSAGAAEGAAPAVETSQAHTAPESAATARPPVEAPGIAPVEPPASASAASVPAPAPAPKAVVAPTTQAQPARTAPAPSTPARTAVQAPTAAARPAVSKQSPAARTAAGSAGSSSTGSSAASVQAARNDAAPATAGRTAGAAPLNLASLEQRLRDTSAIGVMTKITIKNQVDELLERFKAHYDGRDATPLAQLRPPYDTLIRQVLSLVQEKDPSLASSIAASREAIWAVLTDRTRFSSL